MNPAVKTLWLEALRSGRYTQGRGCLTRRHEDGREEHCCLGVLCQLAVNAEVVAETGTDTDSERGVTVRYGLGDRMLLPTSVMHWAALPHDPTVSINGIDHLLASLNDTGLHGQPCDFSAIADLIEKHL
jgi:hypothetical protein